MRGEVVLKERKGNVEAKTTIAKKQAVKSLGLQPFLDAKVRPKAQDARAVLRQKMASEMLRYDEKKLLMAAILWFSMGLLGGHRYYLERIGSGAAMALTGGGFFFWWLADGFRLKKLVNQFNDQQAQRQLKGLPPLGLEFLPTNRFEDLASEPVWLKDAVSKGYPTAMFFLDAVLLMILGIALASVTVSIGILEPLFSAVLLILVILFFDSLMRYSNLPLIHELLHLEFKLRLFYTYNRPGSFLKLFARPIIGLFTAPFDRKARSEVKLYLEISGVFAIFLVAIKLIQTLIPGGASGLSLAAWAADLIKMFLIIYMVTSPIGAVMTKHILMGTKRPKIILLAVVTFTAILLQLVSGI